jgi:hypothetical protein
MMACETEDVLRIVPCTTARILEMRDVREEQQGQLAVTLPLLETRMLEISPEWSRCAVDPLQAAPVAAWGAFPQWPGRAVAWALFTPRAKRYAMRVRNATLFHVEQLQQRDHLRRLEATVDASDPAAIRWAQQLGFEVEALLRSYGPCGEDYFMMARVWT